MKRFLVAIISILYLSSSAGATVHLHYCMGKLVERGLTAPAKEKEACSHCGMESSDAKANCCKHEQKHYKADEEQKRTEPVQWTPLLADLVPTLNYSSTAAYAISSRISALPYSNAPPPLSGLALLAFNCSFRI